MNNIRKEFDANIDSTSNDYLHVSNVALVVPHEFFFIESYCAILIKVCINQSQKQLPEGVL